MKRPIKPFVVEVRKGQKTQKKKTPAVDLLPVELYEEQPRESDALRRAEAALFGAATKADLASQSRFGRILETIPDEEPVAEEPELETRRRGRPPGSRNKPKEFEAAKVEAPTAPKRRGRPPRVLESAVRKVELTPELASAALESIAKAAVVRPVVPIMSAQKAKAVEKAATPKREPRPAKPDKALARQAKLDAKEAKRQAKQQAREAKLKTRPAAGLRKQRALRPMPESPPPQAQPALTLRPTGPLDTLPRLIRMATETAQGDSAALMAAMMRPRAGERWRRRLRGAAYFAYERRHKKSSPTPR